MTVVLETTKGASSGSEAIINKIAKQSSIEKLYQQQVGSSINAESCGDVVDYTSLI